MNWTIFSISMQYCWVFFAFFFPNSTQRSFPLVRHLMVKVKFDIHIVHDIGTEALFFTNIPQIYTLKKMQHEERCLCWIYCLRPNSGCCRVASPAILLTLKTWVTVVNLSLSLDQQNVSKEIKLQIYGNFIASFITFDKLMVDQIEDK